MAIDLMALPNVRIADRLVERYPKEQYRYMFATGDTPYCQYGEAMHTVITKNPQWDFVVSGGNSHRRLESADAAGVREAILVTKVVVFAGKEELGTVAFEYHGSNRKISILNQRLAADRVRNNGKVFTSDAKKAVSLINKAFYRKTPAEVMEEARSKLLITFNNIIGNKNQSIYHHDMKLNSLSTAFVKDKYPELMDILKTFSRGEEVTNALTTYLDAVQDLDALRLMANKHTDGKAVPIVVIRGGYVVHSGDTLSTYTDETLPHELRGPLGMLKLVEPQKLLPVGIRVDDTVFLVVPQGENDAS